MKSQPRSTIVGIAIGSLLINAPRSLAIQVVPGEIVEDSIARLYAYNQPDELVEKLRQQEQKISCQNSSKSDRRKTHFQTWINRAIALQQHQKYSESLFCLDRALAIETKSQQAWYRRAIALSHLKQYSLAVEAYQKAIEINPQEHTSWYNLGNAYKHLGQHQQALKAYQQAIALKPDFQLYNNSLFIPNMLIMQENYRSFLNRSC